MVLTLEHEWSSPQHGAKLLGERPRDPIPVRLRLEKGLYLFDWYGVSEQAAADGKWNMLDDLHQDFDSTRYETDAYLDWAARTLPEEFRPSPR